MILILLVKTSYAQERDTSYKYWMTIGGWIDRDVNLNFNYSFSLGPDFYKVGYFIRGGFSQNPIPSTNGYLYHSVDISIGKRLQSKWFQASLFAGPSYIFGEKRVAANNNEKYNTIGLETDLQLLFRLADEVGIGLGLFGNLNFEKNFTGFDINLTLGNGK